MTSVGLSLPGIFTTSGSPVTTSGSFSVLLANQSGNTVFAGPSTGFPGAPSFRALVADDLPAHTHSIADVTNLQNVLNVKANLSNPTFTGTVSGSIVSLSQGAATPTLVANNTLSTTLGLTSIQGTSTAGNVFLSTFRSILSSNRRAAIYAELGTNTSANASKYAGFFNGRVTVVNNTATISASTTLSQLHAGVTIFCTNSTAITITLPADASNLAFPPGTEITLIRRGAGAVTIATTNISLFSVGSGTANAGRRSIANRNEGVILIKETANTWQLIGAL